MDKIVVIFNIPVKFGGSELRRFFSTFVEAEKFECFHFKRRPESKLEGFQRSFYLQFEGDENDTETDTNIAIAKFVISSHVADFCSYYHMKHWTDNDHNDLVTRCLSFPLGMYQ
jgi:hypothetical protein